jgi:hypothetical protein
MPKKDDEQSVSRRSFLKAAAVTAMAATATGAGAAVLKNTTAPAAISLSAPQPAPVATIAPVAQTIVTGNHEAAPELMAQLAAAQAENVRLQAALDAAQRSLESLQQTGNERSAEAESLSIELASATQRVSLLSGLVALYEQLESVDVGQVLDEGLAAVAVTIGDLLDKAPSLTEGIAAGQQALIELEGHIPLLENGRDWLNDHLGKLQAYYDAVKALLERTVERIGPVLEMINEWFEGVRKWLPFGIGQTAAEVVQSISNLLVETPHTLSGLTTNIVQPLDVWLMGQADEAPLRQKLIKPLREQVLVKAGEAVEQAQQVQVAYQTRLAEPAQAVVGNQRAIREQIAEYRRQHQI